MTTKPTIKSENRLRPYEFGISSLLISNVCFYTQNTMTIYLILSIIGMICIYFKSAWQSRGKIHIYRSFIWLTVIYMMFTIYGCLFLRSGTYNWDMMLFTYISDVALLIAFKRVLQSDKWQLSIERIVIISTIFIVAYISFKEAGNFGQLGLRIGDSLSGNVNSVGVSLGILSVFIAFLNCHKHKKKIFLIFFVTVVFMLITGSKKTIVFLTVDLIIFLVYSKGKATTYLKVGIAACILFFAIFNVQYLYSVIGYRIEDMFYQLLGTGSGVYSHSTDAREIMIKEGFRFFWDNPIFGGGEKYFGLRTSQHYAYSHCNYVEMLCNFGIVGTCIFYIPKFRLLFLSFKYRKKNRDLMILCSSLMVATLIIDWMMVSYSDTCMVYLPTIVSFAILTKKRTEREK